MGIPSPLFCRDFLTGILWQWSVSLVLTIFKMSLGFIGNSLAEMFKFATAWFPSDKRREVVLGMITS
jgi:hypothetical protein